MRMLGDRQRQAIRRGATAVALFLAGILAVVLLIVGTGSIVISALDTGDPIDFVQDIDFGVVLPGEDYPDNFDICIKDAEAGDHVDYTLVLNLKGSLTDMRPFLIVQADDPNETDPLADGPAGDYQAEGDLDSPSNECDGWQVTLSEPHCEGAHNPFTDPQGSDATIACDVDEPTPDPQTWSEGSDLGAEMEINVTVSRQ